MTAPDPLPKGAGIAKVALRLVFVLAVIIALNRLAAWAIDPEYFAPGHFAAHDPMIIAASGIYAVLLAVPFIPGVEIGLALLSVLGPPVVPIVYGATLLGLSMAFGLGRLVPIRVTCGALRRIGLNSAANGIESLARVPPKERMSSLVSKFSAPIARLMVRYPEVTLMLLINLPGNTLIGGGGGIAMAIGMSRLMSFPRFLIAIAVATAPIPLAVYFFGLDPFA